MEDIRKGYKKLLLFEDIMSASSLVFSYDSILVAEITSPNGQTWY
jgi:hypothetical protein